MLLRAVTVLMLVVGQVAVHACLGPENVFGIRLNNGESIDLEVIENLGEEGVNYYKNTQNGLTYSFRSHYNPSIMVEVLIGGGSSDLSGMLTFTVDTSTVPTADLLSGTCVRTELDWLVTAGVLEMERIKRERIEQAFHEHFTASYFWTKQDSLIPNNWIFESNGNGDFIVAMADCGGMEFAAAHLPPHSLDIGAGIVTKDTKTFSRGHVAADPARSSMLLVDINGRVLGQKITGLKSNRPGVFVGYDRRSGVVKRVIALP